ncbi:hypothetical protein D3C77_791680 [compost metagenome]
MVDPDIRLFIEITQQLEHLRPALRIHGAALNGYQHMVGETDRSREQGRLRTGQVDDHMIECTAAVDDMLL